MAPGGGQRGHGHGDGVGNPFHANPRTSMNKNTALTFNTQQILIIQALSWPSLSYFVN